MKLLVVVDMQTDFIDGVLGTPEAERILPYVKERIERFSGRVLFTRDTHEESYLSTEEGRRLPVPHCIRGSLGWQIHPQLQPLCKEEPVDKPTFGSLELLRRIEEGERPEKIEVLGVCTDICVISNVLLLKAAFPEIPIAVDAKGCAGVTPESHTTALAAMRACQIDILE